MDTPSFDLSSALNPSRQLTGTIRRDRSSECFRRFPEVIAHIGAMLQAAQKLVRTHWARLSDARTKGACCGLIWPSCLAKAQAEGTPLQVGLLAYGSRFSSYTPTAKSRQIPRHGHPARHVLIVDVSLDG